jgi:hypothetical protein
MPICSFLSLVASSSASRTLEVLGDLVAREVEALEGAKSVAVGRLGVEDAAVGLDRGARVVDLGVLDAADPLLEGDDPLGLVEGADAALEHVDEVLPLALALVQAREVVEGRTFSGSISRTRR